MGAKLSKEFYPIQEEKQCSQQVDMVETMIVKNMVKHLCARDYLHPIWNKISLLKTIGLNISVSEVVSLISRPILQITTICLLNKV